MRLPRLLARIVLTLLAVAGLLWPLMLSITDSQGSAPPDDPVVITQYRATYDVAADGTLTAVEDITAAFPSGRHGIFRYWDVADQADPGVRYLPEITGITQDGQPATFDTSWESGERFLVAKIGDPDRYLSPGEHEYRISYTIAGTISPPEAGSAAQFASSAGAVGPAPQSVWLWALVARGWEMPIRDAVTVVSLPAPAGLVECSVGAATGDKPCTIRGAGTQQLTLSASSLPPRSGMIVRAGMQLPAPDRQHLPWPVAWDPILGRSVPPVVVVLVASVVALVAGVGWGRTASEAPPGFPVQYVPPDGLGPVQTVYMHTETVGPAPLVATLMHLAERGMVRLERSPDDEWTVTSLAPAAEWEAVDPMAAGVADELGLLSGGQFTTSATATAGKKLQSATSAIGGDVRRWAHETGLVRTAVGEVWGRVVWVVCLILAVLGFTGLAWPTMLGLPFAAFAIGATPLLEVGVGQRRTLTGRMTWSRAGGFERLLGTPSAEDRFDFAARKDLFIAYVPFAVAFGVADRWAAKYRAAVGSEPPVPGWYPYYPGMSSAAFYSAGAGDPFSTAVSSSISAYTATQSSSSGGGGGFSGGGGGGGGGSW